MAKRKKEKEWNILSIGGRQRERYCSACLLPRVYKDTLLNVIVVPLQAENPPVYTPPKL
jgi:hypothetical protein